MKKTQNTPALDGGRIFRNGLLSTAILAAVVVLAVLVNLVVRMIPTRYTEFDLSEAGLYTLSEQSVALTQSLEQDITIYYLCETGSEDAIITRLLDRYASESSHLTWEQKDPAVYPTFAAQYGAQNVSSGSLILDAGEDSVVLDAADLYEYDYSDYYYSGTYSVKFAGEDKITSALYRLTSGEASAAYYTTNQARAAFYPKLTLSGSAGWTNSLGQAVTNPAGVLINAIGTLAQPIFNKGQLKANLKVSKAQEEIAKQNYKQAILDAGQEVNDALFAIETAGVMLEKHQAQCTDLERTVYTSEKLYYRSAYGSYLEILTARQSLLNAQLSVVSDKYNQLAETVTLYRALGGGKD